VHAMLAQRLHRRATLHYAMHDSTLVVVADFVATFVHESFALHSDRRASLHYADETFVAVLPAAVVA